MSAMGGACGSPGGRRLSLALGGRTDKRVRRETFNRVEHGSGEPGGPYPAGRGAQQRWRRLEAGLLGDGPLMELRHTETGERERLASTDGSRQSLKLGLEHKYDGIFLFQLSKTGVHDK